MACQQDSTGFVDNFIVVWLDSKLHDTDTATDNVHRSIAALCQVVSSVKTFHTCESCINFIDNTIKEEKVAVIVANSLKDQLIPRFLHNKKINSIFVFYFEECIDESLTQHKQHGKIKGYFTDIQDICKQIKDDIKHYQYDLTSIETVGSKTSKISNHLDASFMYSQLLKDIILSTDYDEQKREQAKEDFVNFCQTFYVHKTAELDIIEEFKQLYSKPSPLWWYTRECFIYSMLNRALCKQDTEILIKMNFFIYDLHQQLQQLHRERSNTQVLVVYRGQGILPEALERMKANQGGLISFNNFLSTSKLKEVSLQFARYALRNPDKSAVLFEMTIDPSISTVPFASLDEHSYFHENEQEILFSMHTVFRIGEIMPFERNGDPRLWKVCLTLTDDDDEQLRQLTGLLRQDLSSSMDSELKTYEDPTWRLGKLFVHMGEYPKAIKIYKVILKNAIRDNNSQLEQRTHYQLAELLAIYVNDWKQAISHFQKMFNLIKPDVSMVTTEVRDELKTIFATMKEILNSEDIDENQFHLSMIKLVEGFVNIFLNYPIRSLSPLEFQLIVDRLNYIGLIYQSQGNLTEAWIHHERALEILRKHLPSTHPRLARTYYHISVLYLADDDLGHALECLQKALKIQDKVLKPNHPHLAETHFHLSIVFERLYKIDDAVQHAQKALDIGRQAFETPADPMMKKCQERLDQVLQLNQSPDEIVL